METPDVSSDFITLLQKHSWPGNVRELENLMERILVVYRPPRLEPLYLAREVPHLFGSTGVSVVPGNERENLIKALRLCRGNKTETARVLKMPRRTLYYKIQRLGITEEEYLSE